MIKLLLALFLLLPPWWQDSMNFESLEPGTYKSLALTLDGVEVTFFGTGTDKLPAGVRVIEVEHRLHSYEDFGDRAITGGDKLTAYFKPPVDKVEFRIGSGDCGSTMPGLYCYDKDDNYISGDCGDVFGCTNFGSAALCWDREPFQWLFGNSRTWDGETQYIAHCVLESFDRDVFVGVLTFRVWDED